MRNESKIHGWRIEPREYARQEGRRGRRHAYESIDPARTGLVVIDMVPFFVEADRYARGIGRIADTLRAAGGHGA